MELPRYNGSIYFEASQTCFSIPLIFGTFQGSTKTLELRYKGAFMHSAENGVHSEVLMLPDPGRIMGHQCEKMPISKEVKTKNGEEAHDKSQWDGCVVGSLSFGLQQIPAPVPSMQRAIITPEMDSRLNMVSQVIPVRDPAPGEVVLRIIYTGICRSDACFSVGPGPGYPKNNHIAGHEGIGIVVKSHDLSLLNHTFGLRYLGSTCGSCTYCLRGLLTSCPFQLNTPKQISGTFQEYATVPSSCLVPIPDRIWREDINPALYASALCSGSTSLTSLRAAKVMPGDVIVVAGIAGAIGHMTGAIAKNVFRTRVIGIDVGSKIDVILSQKYEQYSDALISAPVGYEGVAWSEFHGKLLQACRTLRSGGGLLRAAEAVIIASSSFPAFQRLDEYVCDGGRIVCVGVPEGDNTLAIPLRSIVERNLHLAGTLMGGNKEALEVVEFIRSGQIKPHINQVGLEDVPEIMQKLVDCETIGKIVVSI